MLASNELDMTLEPWSLDIVIDLIATYEQPADLNVVIVDDVLREANQLDRFLPQQPNKRQRAFKKQYKQNKKEYPFSRSLSTGRVWGPWPIWCTVYN